MTINITLVVQIINFFIAYVIIDRLYLRKAVAWVNTQDSRQRAARDTLLRNQKEAELIQLHVQDQWQQYRRALQRELPQHIRLSLPFPPLHEKPLSIDLEHKKTLVKKLSSIIVQEFT